MQSTISRAVTAPRSQVGYRRKSRPRSRQRCSRCVVQCPHRRSTYRSPTLTGILEGSQRQAHAVYQVHGRSGWALVEGTTQSVNGRTWLTGIYVQPTAGDPRRLNGFTLQRFGVAKGLMLLAMIAAVAVTIVALVRIWRSGLFERRWLWTIGALIGITSLRMNWSTGVVSFQPLMIVLFSAGAFKQPIFAPWVLSVGLPVVAIIALLRRSPEVRGGAGGEADAI